MISIINIWAVVSVNEAMESLEAWRRWENILVYIWEGLQIKQTGLTFLCNFDKAEQLLTRSAGQLYSQSWRVYLAPELILIPHVNDFISSKTSETAV